MYERLVFPIQQGINMGKKVLSRSVSSLQHALCQRATEPSDIDIIRKVVLCHRLDALGNSRDAMCKRSAPDTSAGASVIE